MARRDGTGEPSIWLAGYLQRYGMEHAVDAATRRLAKQATADVVYSRWAKVVAHELVVRRPHRTTSEALLASWQPGGARRRREVRRHRERIASPVLTLIVERLNGSATSEQLCELPEIQTLMSNYRARCRYRSLAKAGRAPAGLHGAPAYRLGRRSIISDVLYLLLQQGKLRRPWKGHYVVVVKGD